MTFGIVSIKIWKQREKMTVAGRWGCARAAAVLNKDKPLPSQIASRAGTAADSDSVTAHAFVTLGLLSAACPGAQGLTQACSAFSESQFPCPIHNIHTWSGQRCHGADPQLEWADRVLASSSHLKHTAYESDWKNGLQRNSFGYLGLISLLWMFAVQAIRFTVNSFGGTEACCQSNVKHMQCFLLKFPFCRDCLCCRGNPI